MTSGRSIIGDRPEGRPENDFYPTPEHMTKALMECEGFTGRVWEPACGDGSMSRVIENWHTTVSTDIEPRGYGTKFNFFDAYALPCPNIITNPPFKLLNKWIEKCHWLKPDKYALLTKLQALETIERSYILEETKLTRVRIFRARQTIWRNGVAKTTNGGMIPFVWLIWEKGYTGRPEVYWI